MDKQLRRFVAELMQRGHASVSMLASTLGVSERTVRNYVHRASDELSSAARIENNHGQITLDVLDREALDQLVQSTPVDRGNESQATRVSELLCNLVRRSGWVTLVELSDELYSPTSSTPRLARFRTASATSSASSQGLTLGSSAVPDTA